MIDTLEWHALVRGLPAYIRSDNGPEFVAKAVHNWLKEKHCKTIYIEPGSPWEIPYIESFTILAQGNGKLREECLNPYAFADGREAQEIVETWREETDIGHTARWATRRQWNSQPALLAKRELWTSSP